jgi:hypothetical protein
MILESNLLAKLQVGEKMLSHGLNTLHFDGTTDAQKHFLGFQIVDLEQPDGRTVDILLRKKFQQTFCLQSVH